MTIVLKIKDVLEREGNLFATVQIWRFLLILELDNAMLTQG
ncbi:hypothetical protein ACSYAD_13100 [Acaryochloris marina NIES-2412]|nr:hypothetical protein [Acaryochloris sp. 'Moss Beach']